MNNKIIKGMKVVTPSGKRGRVLEVLDDGVYGIALVALGSSGQLFPIDSLKIWERKRSIKGEKIRSEIIALRTNQPNIRASRIAEIIGVSRERVRQILVELDMPTNFFKQRIYHCIECGKEIYKPSNYCQNCYTEKCHKKYRTKLICPYCKKEFSRMNSYVKRQAKLGHRMYCSTSCCDLATWERRRAKLENIKEVT